MQPDGKIVVAAIGPMVLARYLPDGQPDPGFGENGRVVTRLGSDNDWPISVDVLPNGKLLVIASTATLIDAFEGTFKLALVRYLQDGSLDFSFGKRGIVRRHIPDWHDVIDGEVSADGKIVVLVSGGGGSAHCADAYSLQKLWRFRRNGQLDPTFDRDGRAPVTSLNVRGMALQARDRILVAGERCIPPESSTFEMAFAVARYGPDGSLDGRFGNNGTAVNLAEGQHAVPRDLVLQSNTQLLVLGNTVPMDDPFGGGDLAIARYIAA